jgi:hypothetical protein
VSGVDFCLDLCRQNLSEQTAKRRRIGFSYRHKIIDTADLLKGFKNSSFDFRFNPVGNYLASERWMKVGFFSCFETYEYGNLVIQNPVNTGPANI